MDCVSLHSRCVDRKKSSWCIESAIKRKEVLSTTTTIGPGCSLIAHAAWVCELISVFLRPHSCCSGGSSVVLSARHNNSLRYSTARHHSSSTGTGGLSYTAHNTAAPANFVEKLTKKIHNKKMKQIVYAIFDILHRLAILHIYNIYIRLYAVLSWNWCFRPWQVASQSVIGNDGMELFLSRNYIIHI